LRNKENLSACSIHHQRQANHNEPPANQNVWRSARILTIAPAAGQLPWRGMHHKPNIDIAATLAASMADHNECNTINSFHSQRNAFFAVTDRIRVFTVTLFLRVQCMNNKDLFHSSIRQIGDFFVICEIVRRKKTMTCS
jgi:hypothetical protein